MGRNIRNILAVIAGFIIGSIVNMGIIMSSSYIVPPPSGVDVQTMEGLKAGMHLFEPKHFIIPFFAHAIGTLSGAFVAAKIAGTSPIVYAMIVAVLFCIGGLANVIMLPSPIWYTAADLLLAYLPMGYWGYRLADRPRTGES